MGKEEGQEDKAAKENKGKEETEEVEKAVDVGWRGSEKQMEKDQDQEKC